MKYIVDQNITLDQLINLYTSFGWSSYTQNSRATTKGSGKFAFGYWRL